MHTPFVLIRWCSWCLFLIHLSKTNGLCTDDEELQNNRCTCNLQNLFIQCSSLPRSCQTCYRYKTIFFDEKVNILPPEIFHRYDFFELNTNQSFTMQFAHIKAISSRTFSKINIDQGCNLRINIAKFSSPTIPTRTFDEIAIEANSKIDIEIYHVTSPMLTFEQYVFDGIIYNFQSEFSLTIRSLKHTLEFQSNAGSISLPQNAKMDLHFSNFNQLLLNEKSFDHITQQRFSQLQISFDKFESATLAHASFFDLHQLDNSHFYLMFANLQNMNIEKTLFDTITQLHSSITFSVSNISNNLCLPTEAFSQIKQDVNSTFQFLVNYGQNILFNSHAFINISQRAESTLAISTFNSLDVYFTKQSLIDFRQQDRSFLDIWIRHGKSLIFEDNSIQNINIWRSSILRIGFQHSSGTLQMATNAFSNIKEVQGGAILFQIINSTDFYFRFNQSIQLERLEIVDRILSDNDLCRISEIPSHIPIKVPQESLCSCSTFYLYRQLRHKLSPTELNKLLPNCYLRLSLDEIENGEHKCAFNKKIDNCRQMQGDVKVHIPNGLCQKNARSSKSHRYRPSLLSFIFILICLVSGIACVYTLTTSKRYSVLEDMLHKLNVFRHHRQRLPIFTADSYQQLTHMNGTISEDDIHSDRAPSRIMKIIVKYNSTTDQTQPYIHCNRSDFVSTNDPDDEPNEDVTLQLNTNPLSDIEHFQ